MSALRVPLPPEWKHAVVLRQAEDINRLELENAELLASRDKAAQQNRELKVRLEAALAELARLRAKARSEASSVTPVPTATTVNPIARGQVLAALQRAGRPVTRGELTNFPGPRLSAAVIQGAIDDLVANGLVVVVTASEGRSGKTGTTYALAEGPRNQESAK